VAHGGFGAVYKAKPLKDLNPALMSSDGYVAVKLLGKQANMQKEVERHQIAQQHCGHYVVPLIEHAYGLVST
jgi:hypothetical protein